MHGMHILSCHGRDKLDTLHMKMGIDERNASVTCPQVATSTNIPPSKILSTTMAQTPIDLYWTKRKAIIAEDRSFRRENIAPASSFSTNDIEADKLVREARALEASTIWTAKYEDTPHPFPGMEFLNARKIMLQSKLFNMLTKASSDQLYNRLLTLCRCQRVSYATSNRSK